MADPQKALETQLSNIEKKTGKSLVELKAIGLKTGLEKHGEIRSFYKTTFNLGYGDANALAALARQAGSPEKASVTTGTPDSALDSIYSGAKAPLLPIHEMVMGKINKFGKFEIAPKKTYLSLRRKKQFAMVGPATKTQVEIGINTKTPLDSDRLKVMPPKSMCSYTCRIASLAEVDAELLGWIKVAFDEAG